MWRYEVLYELYDFGGRVFHLADGNGDNVPAEIVRRALKMYLIVQLNKEKNPVLFTHNNSLTFFDLFVLPR